MITIKGTVSNDGIDNNNHLNISKYVLMVDKSNDKLLKKIIKDKKIHFVSKKVLLENKKEMILNEKWKIKSFLIKISQNFIITKHEIISISKKIIVGNCFLLLVPINNKSKKINPIRIKQKKNLNKFLKKGYSNPF